MNGSSRPERIYGFFLLGRDVPVAERERWLAGQPLADDEREEVRRLLAGAGGGGDPAAATAALDADLVAAAARGLAGAGARAAHERESIERPDDAIGPYRLLEVIGEGGFGVVWLAERREPMVQRVALKVIKPGMDSRAVVARFEQERQALAVMDHPNVARVFDGGVTASGRPYFVMEHVDGESITAYADRKRLTLRQRLELFVPVCEAVQHAHHKGLIHRDLKPSNVLVAEIEGKPVPKVIDFGVAKAVAGEGWANTAHTQSGMVIGTPLYMSPEQVSGQTDVDTRADVYSLGVMLYELLTGEVPFDAAMLRRAALAEVQRIIREETPLKPSTRLAQLADARTTTVAEARSASRERLAGELRRELDWIPLMALRKERERRYESPQALADDLRRYLDGRPLRAAPESRAYLARKFVRRNRVQVLAAAVVFLALSAGLVVSLWQRNEAIRAKDAEAEQRGEAEAQRNRADKRAEQLQKVADFQSRMLSQIDTTQAGAELMKDVRERFAAALEESGVPDSERGTRLEAFRQELVRVNATDAAARMIDRTILRPAIKAIDEQFKEDPEIDASLRQALASLYRSIGLYDAAYPLQKSALDFRRAVLGDDKLETVVSMASLGVLLENQGRLSEAATVTLEALATSRQAFGDDHPVTLSLLSDAGVLFHSRGLLDQAEAFHAEALERRRRVLGDDHPDTLLSINGLGVLRESQGLYDEAIQYHREALEGRRRVLGEDHRETLSSVGNLSSALISVAELSEAEALGREAISKSRIVLGEEHPATLHWVNNLAVILEMQGRLDEAEPYYQLALATNRRVLGDDHPNTIASINNLGALLWSRGLYPESEVLCREALERSRRILGPDHQNTITALDSLGALLRQQGRLLEAESCQLEALEGFVRVLGEIHPSTISCLGNLGDLYEALQRYDDAERSFGRAMRASEASFGAEDSLTLVFQSRMADMMAASGRLEEAESVYRRVLQVRRRVLGEDDPGSISSLANLGQVLSFLGKVDEAERLLREALERSRRVRGEQDAETIGLFVVNASLLASRGKAKETDALIGEFEPVVRSVLIDGETPHLTGMLVTLGCLRVELGFDRRRFGKAQSELLEAYPVLLGRFGHQHEYSRRCAECLVDLYTAWHASEPEAGHDARAAEWRAILESPEALPTDSQPPSPSS